MIAAKVSSVFSKVLEEAEVLRKEIQSNDIYKQAESKLFEFIPMSKKLLGSNQETICLTQIKGIGPAAVKKLNSQGINSVNDLAAINEAQLKALSTSKAIGKWVEQAKYLIK